MYEANIHINNISFTVVDGTDKQNDNKRILKVASLEQDQLTNRESVIELDRTVDETTADHASRTRIVPGLVLFTINKIDTEQWLNDHMKAYDLDLTTYVHSSLQTKSSKTTARLAEKWHVVMKFLKTSFAAGVPTIGSLLLEFHIPIIDTNLGYGMYLLHFCLLVSYKTDLEIHHCFDCHICTEYSLLHRQSLDDVDNVAASGQSQESVLSNPAIIHNQEDLPQSCIRASSFRKDCEPYKCSFYHTNHCWMPTENDQSFGNPWIWFDLQYVECITKIKVQKHPQGDSYIKSFWLDYSDDCCQWKTYDTRELVTQYHDWDSESDEDDEEEDDGDENKGDDNDNNISGTKNLNENSNINNDTSEHHIWPHIKARFIRIRPCEYHNNIALRLEIYSIEDTNKMQDFSRMIQPSKLNDKHRKVCYQLISNLSAGKYVQQLDCSKWVQNALEKAQINHAGFIELDGADSLLCMFSTSDGASSERVLNELAMIGFGGSYGIMSLSKVELRKVEFIIIKIYVCTCIHVVLFCFNIN